MKNKILLFIGIVVLAVPLMACSESAPPAQSTWMSEVEAMWKATPTWNAYGDQIKNLQDQMSKKADMSLVTELIKAGGGGGGNSYSKDEVYTKDQVNSTVATAIDNLKKDQSWITKSSSSTTPTSSTTISDNAKLLDSDGDLELWLEWVDPDRDEIRFSSNFVDFQIAIKNLSTTTDKYTLELRFTPDTSVTVNPLTGANPSTITDRPDMGTWTMDGDRTVASKSAVTFYSAEGRISREAIDKYTITIKIDEPDNKAYWAKKFYIVEVTD
ncbi:MAG: hypothetical protein WC365_03745 [Candidatus Babeliales bacterium]|jgi:hypothetical protein